MSLRAKEADPGCSTASKMRILLATTAMGAKYFAEQVNKLTGGRVESGVFTGGG